MANDLFRELVTIARDYLHPFQAENLIRKLCEKSNTTEDDIKPKHLPSLVLVIATDNNLYEKLKFHQYVDMMKRFIVFSNKLEEVDLDKAREFVREQKIQKKNMET